MFALQQINPIMVRVAEQRVGFAIEIGEGMFVEEANPKELYLRPRSAFTATFLGETNLIAGKVVGRAASDGLWQVETPHGPIVCATAYEPEGHNNVWVACRPEGVVVTAARPVGENIVPGRIMAVVFAGDQIMYSIAVGAQEIRVKSDPFCGFQDGDQVFVQLPCERCFLIRRDDDCQKEVADASSQR